MILSVLSSPALVSGLMVVRAKNPVHSVLFPIPVFRNTSGLLLLLGLDFFAMIFPVVHIGAIAISFLFVVMMFHIQIAEIHEEVLCYLPVSGIIGLIFWWEMFFILDNESIPLLPTQRNTTSLRYTVYAGKEDYNEEDDRPTHDLRKGKSSGYSNKSCFLWFSHVTTSVPIRSIRNGSVKHSIREPGLTLLCGIHSLSALGITSSSGWNSSQNPTTSPTSLPPTLSRTSIETEWFHARCLLPSSIYKATEWLSLLQTSPKRQEVFKKFLADAQVPVESTPTNLENVVGIFTALVAISFSDDDLPYGQCRLNFIYKAFFALALSLTPSWHCWHISQDCNLPSNPRGLLYCLYLFSFLFRMKQAIEVSEKLVSSTLSYRASREDNLPILSFS
ncbi:hypothetical protein ACH5RR_014607 [Cinchona calisaya]|uniref:NADH-ubiquinone oxidoreductase chain 6 n=1 Tax=Cinchona calisaya TaxID=153742 RepID=A0ABD3A3A4_9GENT